MNETFNLIDEPWIEVIDFNGVQQEVSIRELLCNADKYADFASDLGTVNFAVLRVLLAVMYRAWDSEEWRDFYQALDHWEEKWQQVSLLDAEVEEYLSIWQHRFDLRDEVAPFFQVAELHTSKNEWKNLELLVPDVGDQGDLYTMRSGMESISAAEAARMVVHVMAYDFSGIKSAAVGDARVKNGRGYPIGIGWAGWLGGTILKGDNLRETLLLNYVPKRDEAGANDRPLWEQQPLDASCRTDEKYNLKNPERNGATGLVDLLTWPQRRIRLRWSADRVDAVLVTNGDPVGYTAKHGIETMTPWRYSDPQTKKAKQVVYMPRALDSDREMWRSVSGILVNKSAELVKNKYADKIQIAQPATTVWWVGELIAEDILPKDKNLRLHMVSMEYGSNNSSYRGIVEDSLAIKTPLLDTRSEHSEQLRAVMRSAVEKADDTSKLVGSFYRDLIFAVSGEKQVDTAEVREQFFTVIDREFRHWLRDLPEHEDSLAALEDWSKLLKEQALLLARNILEQQGPKVWTGRWDDGRNVRITGANAESWLHRKLKHLLDPATNNTGYEGD